MRTIALAASLLAITHQSNAAEEKSFNRFQLGQGVGYSKSLKIRDKNQGVEFEGHGLMTTLYAGFAFTPNFALRYNVTEISDMDFFFFAGDQYEFRSQELELIYTNQFNSRYFFRANIGASQWDVKAKEYLRLLFIELYDEDEPIYTHEDTSFTIGGSFGAKYGDWFEWTMIGYDTLQSDIIESHTAYMAFTFSF